MPELADGQYAGRILGGRYRLGNQIDKGGMGAVYEAVQEGLGRRVAVKLLHPHLARDVTLLERFRREADMAGGLGHPNIVQITDFQALPGEPAIIVMEFLVGIPLSKILSGGRVIDQARLVNIAIQVCAGLGAAHAAGIVHRDLKPPNIFLTEIAGGGELVKLLDFGIAKLKESAEYSRLTKTGVLVGTPQFMAPEQAQGDPVDGRADLWALGVCMYRALAGTLPFQGDSPADLWKAILAGSPVPLETYRPEIDPDLAAVVRRVLAPDRDKRFASAAEMQAALTVISLRPSLVAGIPPTVASMAVSRASGVPPARISAMPAAPRASAAGPTGRTSASSARPSRAWLLPVIIAAVVLGLVVVAGIAVFAFGLLGVRSVTGHAAPPSVPSAPGPPTVLPVSTSPDSKPPLTPEDNGAPTGALVPTPSPTDVPPGGTTLAPAPGPGQSALVPTEPAGGTGTTLLGPAPAAIQAGGARGAVTVSSVVVVDELYRHDEIRTAFAPMLTNIALCFELASVTPREIVSYRWRVDFDGSGTATGLHATGDRSAVDSLASCMESQRSQLRLGPPRSGQGGSFQLRFAAQ